MIVYLFYIMSNESYSMCFDNRVNEYFKCLIESENSSNQFFERVENINVI